MNFDDEARKLFAKLGLSKSGQVAGGRYNNLDPIYVTPGSKATVYVGNESAARSRDILSAAKVTHVVNCTVRSRSSTTQWIFLAVCALCLIQLICCRWSQVVACDCDVGLCADLSPTQENIPNFYEKTSKPLAYLRFPISYWSQKVTM
eukprot:4378064-Pleurochrysis_carterae.AAC.1